MDDNNVTLILYHGGLLEFSGENGSVSYEGGQMCVWEDLDFDRINVNIVTLMGKEHGYAVFQNIWWRDPTVSEDIVLNELSTDRDIMDICKAAKLNNGEIEIYFEHPHHKPLSMIPPPPPPPPPADEDGAVVVIESIVADEDGLGCGVGNVSEEGSGIGAENGNERVTGEGSEIGADNVNERVTGEGSGIGSVHGNERVTGEGSGIGAGNGNESVTGEGSGIGGVHGNERVAVEDVNEIVNEEENRRRNDKGKQKAFEQYDFHGMGRRINDPVSDDNSGTESDGDAFNMAHTKGKSVLTGTESDNDSDYIPDEIEEENWSLDDDNNSYCSEDLHSPVSTDDEGNCRVKQTFPQFDETAGYGNIHLELGMEFPNLQSFKEAVIDYTVEVGRQIRWLKNDKDRCRAECMGETCKWKIYCAWSRARQSFQIKTYVEEHTCSRSFRNKQASTRWVAKKLEKKLRAQPSMTHAEAFDYMKTEFGVHLYETKIWRSMKKARKMVEGSEAEQYAKLWDYAHELLLSNPGSTVKMDTIPISETERQFKRIYICLDGCKRGFKAGCRPLIGLDGCFLKGYYGGQLLSAVGQDANNHLYVIAYAVVNVENKDNWKWFLELLHADLGDYQQYGWCFISDMQKSLIPAMQEVMLVCTIGSVQCTFGGTSQSNGKTKR
ncbi:uncharacterized protein LOC130722617 isoform X2 [Lotus japonicus]|nr:uncharacterized protein LOC130722617 isoform X2 [Lotus japonicus]